MLRVPLVLAATAILALAQGAPVAIPECPEDTVPFSGACVSEDHPCRSMIACPRNAKCHDKNGVCVADCFPGFEAIGIGEYKTRFAPPAGKEDEEFGGFSSAEEKRNYDHDILHPQACVPFNPCNGVACPANMVCYAGDTDPDKCLAMCAPGFFQDPKTRSCKKNKVAPFADDDGARAIRPEIKPVARAVREKLMNSGAGIGKAGCVDRGVKGSQCPEGATCTYEAGRCDVNCEPGFVAMDGHCTAHDPCVSIKREEGTTYESLHGYPDVCVGRCVPGFKQVGNKCVKA